MPTKNRKITKKTTASYEQEIFETVEESEVTNSTSSIDIDDDELIILNNSVIHSYSNDKIEHFQTLASRYIENCKDMHVSIDPSIVIALRTGWTVLQPTRRFTEGSMLPLMDILETDETIKKVNFAHVSMQDSRFRAAGNGNSNARVLNHILQRNTWIEELDLSNNGLDDDGIREISEGLACNKTLKKINLSSNHFGPQGAKALKMALLQNNKLESIDLSRNALGFHSINSILCVCNPKKIAVSTFGNYVFEEILNSVSHGVAFLMSVIAANILISEAADVYKTTYHFWACVIYSFSLMFLFLSSCLFHSFFMLPKTYRVLQILDHIGIYMVIAGSFTPFLLIGMNQYTSARVLLSAQWLIAFLGSVFAICADFNNILTTVIELILFVSMGLGIFFVWPLLVQEFSNEVIVLLIVGGALYLLGIIFFLLGEIKPIYHSVWHMFVVVAAAVHWFDIYFFVVQKNITDSPTKEVLSDFIDLCNQKYGYYNIYKNKL